MENSILLSHCLQIIPSCILCDFSTDTFSLEVNSTVAAFFTDGITPERLLRYLASWAKEKIIPGEALLIFDKIQSCERALTALKYFCEEAPAFHIGEHVRSRSLSVFTSSYHPAYSIRLSLKNFGETNGLKSVPLYAAFCI